MNEEKKINCPNCGKELEVDSVRNHKSGKKRIYWECSDCNLSIMWRIGSPQYKKPGDYLL